ncbi:glycosyltransferase family 2 protein [Turicibacter bilis]|uniref:glycosyltransferase family 2 protein n=1 Tax=Turicibacter bilis TaxID=2735723 RepID=UPI0031BBAD96
MEAKLTIFTPTYNRAYILPKLYNSLLNQSNKEFIWLVVDDGSTDETESLVQEWIKEQKISIQYIKQENQGKHIAHNTGVENCQTELFFCVDSDDYLLEHAIETIIKDSNNLIDDKVCGIVYTRIKDDFSPVGTLMPNNIEYSSLSDLYEQFKYKGDTALVFKTRIVEQYKFPKINGEKFIGEEYIYCQIDMKYVLYISQEKFYVCEYLKDGYTQNMVKLIKKNPQGYMLLKKKKMECSQSLKIKYKNASLYIVGGWLSNNSGIIVNSPNKIITILSLPLALLIYLIRFKKRI